MKRSSEKFLGDLYEEKLRHKGHRKELVLQKLVIVVGLFGIGTIKIPTVDLTNLLYCVPFVAMACDMYIFAEDFKVKRVGLFVQRISKLCRRCRLDGGRRLDRFRTKTHELDIISVRRPWGRECSSTPDHTAETR